MHSTIYALIDPRTLQVRYIGSTRTSPKARLESHFWKCNLERTDARAFWCQELKALGLRPMLVELERIPWPHSAVPREKHWIALAHAGGCDLLNTTYMPAGVPGAA